MPVYRPRSDLLRDDDRTPPGWGRCKNNEEMRARSALSAGEGGKSRSAESLPAWEHRETSEKGGRVPYGGGAAQSFCRQESRRGRGNRGFSLASASSADRFAW